MIILRDLLSVREDFKGDSHVGYNGRRKVCGVFSKTFDTATLRGSKMEEVLVEGPPRDAWGDDDDDHDCANVDARGDDKEMAQSEPEINVPIVHIPGFTYPVERFFLEDVLADTAFDLKAFYGAGGNRRRKSRWSGTRRIDDDAEGKIAAMRRAFQRTATTRKSRRWVRRMHGA